MRALLLTVRIVGIAALLIAIIALAVLELVRGDLGSS